ncbi:MAG: hypothetical protein ABEI53_01700 [Candidatus Magasanikbacteria bacterium]
MKVTKASGEKEEYSQEKFCNSLKRAGVPSPVVDKTCKIMEEKIDSGIETNKLFKQAREVLMEENPILAGKYSLKQAIMKLGPAGYHFEKYFAAILEEYSYQTQTNQNMQGKCITHETDILAEKNDNHFIIEAKYHNERGIKSDTQTALYTHERFRDIKEHHIKNKEEGFNHKSWLVTNTKLTSMALDYARCRNIKVTGWNCAINGKSLEKIIEKRSLYPVTLLPAVNKFARRAFAKKDIFFAKDLIYFSKEDLHKKFGIYKDVAKKIHNQAKEIEKDDN